jgi:hypothetical protein
MNRAYRVTPQLRALQLSAGNETATSGYRKPGSDGTQREQPLSQPPIMSTSLFHRTPSGPRRLGNDDFFFDIVLPAQFFTSPRHSPAFWRGERRLLLAVLQDAMACWFRYRDARKPWGQRIFRETYEWFWAKEQDRLCTFERICDILNLDPDYIRRGLTRWRGATPDQQTPFIGVRRTLSSSHLSSIRTRAVVPALRRDEGHVKSGRG